MRNKKINLQKVENKFNKNVQQFISIYAQMKEEPELKKLDTDRNVRDYRKERWEKALKLANGGELKAYNLLASEDFY